MDAKSKAQFMNSIGNDEKTKPDGEKKKENNENNTNGTFSSYVEEKKDAEEIESVFAEGLPEWSIEPPQIVVRRKRKK